MKCERHLKRERVTQTLFPPADGVLAIEGARRGPSPPHTFTHLFDQVATRREEGRLLTLDITTTRGHDARPHSLRTILPLELEWLRQVLMVSPTPCREGEGVLACVPREVMRGDELRW